jgi:hypothetical protein
LRVRLVDSVVAISGVLGFSWTIFSLTK